MILGGGIYDKNDVMIGVGVIGDGLSMFDSEFEKAKRRIYERNR